MLRSTLNTQHSTFVPAFTLVETLLVIAIMSIVFVGMRPAYDAFRVRSQVQNATDRTRQIIEKAKTLAISGFRPNQASAQAKFFVIEIKKGEKKIVLCMQDLDAKIDPSSLAIQPCTTTNAIETAQLGQISVYSDNATIAFFPPFGETTVQPSVKTIDIILRQGDSTLPRAQSKLLFTRATGRIEVQ